MVCFSSPRLLFCPEPLKSTPFPPILFSVCKALFISVFCRLLRSLSYSFIFLFKKFLFSSSAIIFSILLLPLGFLLSFSSLRLSLILPQTPHSCFCLSKLFLPPSRGKKWEGWVDFFAMNTQERSNQYFEILQRRACTSLSTLSKFATAVNESLTNV